MSVKKEGRDNFRAYADWRINGERKRMSKGGFKTEKSANAWINKVVKSADESTAQTITFSELLTIYTDRKKETVEEQTLESIQYRGNHYMAKLLTMKLGSIKPLTLERWRNDLVQIDRSSKTKNEIIHQLRAMFGLAARLFYITDPSINLESVKEEFKLDTEDDEVIRVISPQEFTVFYDSLPEATDNDKYFKAMIMATWATGMRRGEVKGIQRKNYNDSIFTINKSVTGKTRGDRAKIGRTKTRSSVRMVNVDEVCANELKRLLTFVDNIYGSNPNWFMFGGLKPLPNNVIQYRFINGLIDAGMVKAYCTTCEATYTIKTRTNAQYRSFTCPVCGASIESTAPRFHDLRHSHATILLNNGAPISAVSARLGHSSINMTLKVYAHATKQAVNALMNELPNLYFGQILDKSEK